MPLINCVSPRMEACASKSVLRRISKFIRNSPCHLHRHFSRRSCSSSRHEESCHVCGDENCLEQVNECVECAVDPRRIYRAQLRILLKHGSESRKFSETDLTRMTRSLSEGDLRDFDDSSNDFYENVMDRYGLIAQDYHGINTL